MAEYEKIEERLISGKGILKVPENKAKFRHAYLCLDVIREPVNKYLNLNWNPPRGKFAFLTFRRSGYVIATASMEFEKTVYDSVSDIAGQTLIAVKCAYEGILTSFVNLGVALGAPPISYTDLIKDYENMQLGWDEVLIKCYADTAIQARLFSVKYDSCSPDKDKSKKPPPPPPPLPKVPPGTPIGDISRPYDGDDNTDPYEGDEVPPPPPPWGQTEQCSKYRVVATAFDTVRNRQVSQEYELWGEIRSTRLEVVSGVPIYGQQTNFDVECRGGTNAPCNPNFIWVNFLNQIYANTLINPTIEVTPIP